MNSPILKTKTSFLTSPSKQLNLIGIFDKNTTYKRSDIFSAPAVIDAIENLTESTISGESTGNGATKNWVISQGFITSEQLELKNFVTLSNVKTWINNNDLITKNIIADSVIVNGYKTKMVAYSTEKFTGVVANGLYASYGFGPITLFVYGYSAVAYELRIGLTNNVGNAVCRTLYSSTAGVAGTSFAASGAIRTSVGIPQLWADQLPGILHINCNTVKGPVNFRINFASANVLAGITKGIIQIEGTYENQPEYNDIDIILNPDE